MRSPHKSAPVRNEPSGTAVRRFVTRAPSRDDATCLPPAAAALDTLHGTGSHIDPFATGACDSAPAFLFGAALPPQMSATPPVGHRNTQHGKAASMLGSSVVPTMQYTPNVAAAHAGAGAALSAAPPLDAVAAMHAQVRQRMAQMGAQERHVTMQRVLEQRATFVNVRACRLCAVLHCRREHANHLVHGTRDLAEQLHVNGIFI